ncbi:MAG: hypothetical protein KDA96_20600, partial [Planctomycetaceae bacterium]|nr:hypothetical protein [Planctomycetaceae bacterium]
MARRKTIQNDFTPDENDGGGFLPRGSGSAGVGGVSPLNADRGDINPDDSSGDDELRPSRLEDVVGQRAVVERLRILLDATKKRGEPLGHLLLDGPPGLG